MPVDLQEIDPATIIGDDVREWDSQMEGFYKMYRALHPEATITEFDQWFMQLSLVQDTVKLCPWCGCQPALRARLYEGDGKLHFDVQCENEQCPVQPGTQFEYEVPEEAVGVFNG